MMDIKELNSYCTRLIKKHYYKTGEVIPTIQKNDLVNEVFANEYSSMSEAKKHIRNYFLNEARKIKAKRQHTVDFSDYNKVCNTCGELKHSSEYYKKMDKDSGFAYLEYQCKTCHAKRRKEYRARLKAEA